MRKLTVILAVVAFYIHPQMCVQAEFLSGVARVDVTPDPLLPVSGGIGPSAPTWQKKGELSVRALVLRNESTSIALVTSDFLGFPAALGNRVRQAIDSIPQDNILISASHTHSAPDMYGFPDGAGGFNIDMQYADRVVKAMIAAIEKAESSCRMSTLRVAHNRIAERIAFNYYAPELYDRRCGVIQTLDSQTGTPIATLVNYAVHPEVIGADNGIVSADLVWPMTQSIEKSVGGMALFINGAQGGMVTADVRHPQTGVHIQTWEECVRIGERLGSEALRILEGTEAIANPSLVCQHKRVTFPVDSEGMRQIMKYSPLGYTKDGDTSKISTTINFLKIGPAMAVTIPGEALPNIGFYIKRKMPTDFPFLFGLTNDAFGYILTPEDFESFDRYDYVSRTSLGEKTAPILMEAVLPWFQAH